MQNQLRASAPVNNGYTTSVSGSFSMPQQMNAESSNVTSAGIVNAQHSNNRTMPRMAFAGPRDNNELSLKMIVNAKYVGAIIGQNGSIIREISQETKAKCIVEPAIIAKLPRDSNIQAEKIVNISGTQENCSKACVHILEIVQRELIKDNPNAQNEAVELKMKVPNQLIGRLIGKHGATIKKIMDESQALISISDSQFDANQMYPQFQAELFQNDRTIVIKGGTIDIVSAAERKISQKMRQDYEADMSRGMMQQGAGLMGYSPFVSAITPQGLPVDPTNVMFTAFPRFTIPVPFNVVPQTSQPSTTLEKVRLFVPNNVVGALIGSKGQFIKAMMRVTGANIRIEEDEEVSFDSPSIGGKESDQEHSLSSETGQKPNEDSSEPAAQAETDKKQEEVSDRHESPANLDKKQPRATPDKHERTVSIFGNDHQIYRAEFWIFQRIAETQANYIDEVFLSSEVLIPSPLIGRVIGKSGQNVRELQRITQACVRIPCSQSPEATQEPSTESAIHVHGNFFSTQAVQARLSQLVLEYQMRNSTVDPEIEIVQTPVETANNADVLTTTTANNGMNEHTNDVPVDSLPVTINENDLTAL